MQVQLPEMLVQFPVAGGWVVEVVAVVGQNQPDHNRYAARTLLRTCQYASATVPCAGAMGGKEYRAAPNDAPPGPAVPPPPSPCMQRTYAVHIARAAIKRSRGSY